MPLEQRGEVGNIGTLDEVQDQDGNLGHPASDERLESIRVLLDAIDDALSSVGTDEVRVTSPNPLDVGATAELGNWSNGYDNTVAPSDTTVTQLSTGSVPDGVAVLVQADPDNAAPVKIGLTDSPAVRVAAGQSYTAQVSDRSQIRVQLESNGDQVHVTHEVA